MSMPMLQSLSNLKHLRMNLEKSYFPELNRQLEEIGRVPAAFISLHVGLQRLSTLPLETVEVYVRNHSSNGKDDPFLWNRQSRTEFAQQLKDYMLNHGALAAFQEEQQRNKEKNEVRLIRRGVVKEFTRRPDIAGFIAPHNRAFSCHWKSNGHVVRLIVPTS